MAERAPGITRKEIDLSEILVPSGISNGGIVIRAPKGPINRPVLITNDKEFVETFGEPYYVSGSSTGRHVPEYGYGAYAALEFLKESTNLYVVRDYDSSNDKYSTVEIDSNLSGTTSGIAAGSEPSVPDTATRINTLDNAKPTTLNTLLVGALFPGLDGNNIAVTIESFNTSADWKLAYDPYPTEASAVDESQAPSAVDSHYPIAKNVFKLNVYVKKSTESWDGLYSTSADRSNEKVRIAPVETWYGSLGSQLDGNNSQLFIEDIVNGNSKYIYVKVADNSTKFAYITAAANRPVQEDTTSEYVKYDKLQQLGGGASQEDDGLGTTDTGGWTFLEDRERVTVGILICPASTQTIKQEAARVASKRLDCIVATQTGAYTDNTRATIQAAEAYGYQAPSYIALYCGYSKVYDKYNDRFLWLPNAALGAMLMARTDNVANEWSAPAGIDRGTLSVFDQNVVLNSDDIGKIYNKNINCIKFIPSAGFIMWGQKTAQLKSSARDRINVRRLLLYIENNVEASLVQFIFENNTVKTRQRVFNLIDTFLGGLRSADAFDLTNGQGYEVVVDETNNTADVIDRNEMVVDIYVSPAKTIEFIQLNVIITRSGVQFSEVQ